jgi:hypothetical protein
MAPAYYVRPERQVSSGRVAVAKVRVGIVGSDFMARIHHGCLARIPDAEVVAVASPTPGHG